MTTISWQDRKREQKIKQKRVERQYQQGNQLPPGEYTATIESINDEGMVVFKVEHPKGRRIKVSSHHFSSKRKRGS